MQPKVTQKVPIEEMMTLFFEETGVHPVVLAMACGGGKTFMSIFIAWQYIKRNPGKKVLVLAHGQRELRKQYFLECHKHVDGEFKYDIVTKVSEFYEKWEKNDLIVTLPQTIGRLRKIENVGLLIVDEAHQFYFADTVQRLIKRTKPHKQLLLTGTPSKFIYANSEKKQYELVSLSYDEVLAAGEAANIYIENATTSYPLTMKDYTRAQDVKSTFHFDTEITTITLRDVIYTLFSNRLRSFKHPGKYTPLNKVRIPWSKLGRTIIACRSQEQGKDVERLLNEIGVSNILSISDTDKEGANIDTFRDDQSIKVLIVVGRGILGFSIDELENVIDMTCSQNLDRIFQLLMRLARLLRDENNNVIKQKKLFIKVVPEVDATNKGLSDYFKYIMSGVQLLCHKDWFLKFNGKNYLQVNIPTKKNVCMVEGEKDDEDKPKKKRKKSDKPSSIKEQNLGLPDNLQLMIDVYNKRNEPYSPYAWSSLADIRQKLLGITTPGQTADYHMDIMRKCGENKELFPSETKIWFERLKWTMDGSRCNQSWRRDTVERLYNEAKPIYDSLYSDWYDLSQLFEDVGGVGCKRRFSVYMKNNFNVVKVGCKRCITPEEAEEYKSRFEGRMKTSEIAEHFGISKTRMNGLLSRNNVPFKETHRGRVYHPDDVQQHIEHILEKPPKGWIGLREVDKLEGEHAGSTLVWLNNHKDQLPKNFIFTQKRNRGYNYVDYEAYKKLRKNTPDIKPKRNFTDEEVREIRSSNLSLAKLGEKFGAHTSTIHAVKNRRTYTHVK